jgi:hypothetical protein
MAMILPSILTLMTLVFVRASAQSTDDAKEPRWNVTAECQMVVVPQKTALVLLPDLLEQSKIEGAHGKLQQMIAAGEAELASHFIANFREGERSVSESVENFRYATEFEPPKLPDKASQYPDVLKDWPLVGITPTAFETRNIGTSCEIEVRVHSSGQWLRTTVHPQHVRLLRWTKIEAGKLANGEHLFVEQPIFHTMGSTSSLVLRNGRRVLLGAHKIPDADKMEFFLMRVVAKPITSK